MGYYNVYVGYQYMYLYHKTETVLDKLKRNRKKGLYISTITLAELEFGNANANSSYKERNQLALLEFLTILEGFTAALQNRAQ